VLVRRPDPGVELLRVQVLEKLLAVDGCLVDETQSLLVLQRHHSFPVTELPGDLVA
jgi:hypothetical protein